MHQHTDCCILSIKLAVCLQTVGTGVQAADPYTDEVMLLATHALARTSQRNSVTKSWLVYILIEALCTTWAKEALYVAWRLGLRSLPAYITCTLSLAETV